MHRNWIVLALAAAVAVGCGPSEEARKAAEAEARRAEWASIEAAKKALDAKRTELAELRAQLESGAEVQADVDRVNAEVTADQEKFSGELTGFINDDPPAVGEPMRPDQLAAIRMKSSEDILVAREFIDLGGDYRRAIEIYQAALAVDPDNEQLKAALAEAEANRFMTEERLAAVQKGMAQSEVVAVIGRPYTRNVRDYPETRVTAWFYPTDEAGNAAGVFFKPDGEKKVVYQTKIDAVKAGGGEAEQP